MIKKPNKKTNTKNSSIKQNINYMKKSRENKITKKEFLKNQEFLKQAIKNRFNKKISKEIQEKKLNKTLEEVRKDIFNIIRKDKEFIKKKYPTLSYLISEKYKSKNFVELNIDKLKTQNKQNIDKKLNMRLEMLISKLKENDKIQNFYIEELIKNLIK